MKKYIFALSMAFACVFCAQASLVFENAIVRTTPPGQANTAAYMTIKNTSNKDIHLTKVSSDESIKTEFHTHNWENGMAKMQKLASLTIPANQSVELKSGGMHLMLFKLTPGWQKEHCVIFMLHDKDNNAYKVMAEIKDITSSKHSDHSHH